MLAIKLRPVGKKKQISYRVVVMEKKSKLKGKFVEDLGWYNPHTNLCSVRAERVEYWIKSGAQPTDTVHNVLVKAKLQEGPKIAKHGKPSKEALEKKAAEAAAAAEAQAAKEAAPEVKEETAAEVVPEAVEVPEAEVSPAQTEEQAVEEVKTE